MRILIIILAVFISGCTNKDKTKETLYKSGFSDVKTGGYDFFACGRDDIFSTHFKAKNPAGNYVEGTVCCGRFFKGCTVRY